MKTSENTNLIRQAMTTCIAVHSGQVRRKSGLPYYTHPISVFSIVKKFKESRQIEALCCASLLHDTIEDTTVTFSELKRDFGPVVANLVKELTNDDEEKEKLGKEAYMNKKLLHLSNWALVIKLADILDNSSDNPTDFMLNRIYNNMKFLKENRVLTTTQEKIYVQIIQLISEYKPELIKKIDEKKKFNLFKFFSKEKIKNG